MTFWIFFDIFDFSLWGEERAKKNDVFDILDFFDIFDFSLWDGEPGSGGPGNPGGAHPSGNPGRGQAASAHRLLWYTVRTPLGKPNWGKIDVFDILDFFDIFDFSLWDGEPGLGGPGNPGGAGSSGNPGRGQAASADRLLW